MQLFNGRNGRLSMTYSPPNFIDVDDAERRVLRRDGDDADVREPHRHAASRSCIDGANVTASFFNVLGVTPRLGRGLVDADGDRRRPTSS